MTALPPPPEGTRLALIEAGFLLFGQQSFAATSTRQLAAHANANIGSIAYHFGGKEGLRQACAEEFARRLGTVPAVAASSAHLSKAEARVQLRAIFSGFVSFLFGGPMAETMLPFMLRELTEDGPGVDILYSRIVGPTHVRLCALWAAATGQAAETDQVRLRVFSLIGQAFYFRVGAPIVMRRMAWSAIGSSEAALIAQTLLGNLDAMLDALERS